MSPVVLRGALLSLLALTLSVASGCGQQAAVKPSINALQGWVEANKYVPFTVARGDWGPGTVVDFPDGAEEIVAFDKDCLELAQNNLVETSQAALVSGSYLIRNAGSADLSLTRTFGKQLDLSGAFKDQRVSAIKVSLGGATEEASSVTALRERATALTEAHKDECVNTLFSRDNAIICRVLVVAGFAYDFQGSAGSSIGMDASLLKSMSVSGTVADALSGKAGLTSETPTMVGYRLCRLKAKAGYDASQMSVVELTPEEVLALKSQRKGQPASSAL